MEKLKPCPFCGGEGDIAEGQSYGFARQYQSCCRYCGVTLDVFDTLEEAVEAWNRRPALENKPLTNSERIRSMSDEDLEKILLKSDLAETIPFCKSLPECEAILARDDFATIPAELCEKCVAKWLKEEQEDIK